MECSHDCLRCPYDDCIWPDEDFELTALEIAQSEQLDREAERMCCEADFVPDEAKSEEARRRHQRRKWYIDHRGSELKKRAAWRAENKEKEQKRHASYYEAHKEEINRRKREKRALEKARKKQGNHAE